MTWRSLSSKHPSVPNEPLGWDHSSHPTLPRYGERMGKRKVLPSGANRALLLMHASRLSDRRCNLDLRPFNRRQLTGSLRLQQPGIMGIYQLLARMRIL